MSRLAVVLVAMFALAACSVSPATSLGPGSFAPPSSAGGSPGPITIDTTLLAVLPRDISSIPVIESTEGETDALSDPVLPRIATAAVAVVAVDTTTSDLVYAIVVRLRPDVFTDDAYRDWRDSYDEGACGGVSNVVGHAQSTIGGNSVYIATCANGLRTYHAKLETRSILISASSTGDRRFGILLLGNLRT